MEKNDGAITNKRHRWNRLSKTHNQRKNLCTWIMMSLWSGTEIDQTERINEN